MHHDTGLVEARVARAYRELIAPAVHRATVPVEVEAWDVPGEPVPFADAVTRSYAPLAPGTPWGRPWGTTWMRIRGSVPAGWPAQAPVELVVDLGFVPGSPGFQAEGLVHDPSGRLLKGLEPRNRHVPLTACPGEEFDVWVEAASNPNLAGDWTYRPTDKGDPLTAGSAPLYRFGGAQLCLRDLDAFHLASDVETLVGLLATLPPESVRRAQVLRALERAVDAVDPDAVSDTVAAARERLAPALAAAAPGSSHRVVAVGHAHIDSAWLWPTRETVRKCARTFSNVLQLMDEYPDLVFAASSAQQYAWVKEHYPDLFARLRERVADGRFVPVGGMWVESDVNMPTGEALVRQFLHGTTFFREELGVEPAEVWLPDSFGYSAALPQIAVGAGIRNFLTQKTSWSEANRIPHHTFWWEGIDGTRIFTHFPPVDLYNSDLSAQDLARATRQHAERGFSDVSLVPFGYGDGGGGPTREMMETARRKRDLDGSATVVVDRPAAFFDQARSEHQSPAVWSGELYLELHRGTYTSQARTKAGNRRCEQLLREAELWATTAAVRLGAEYPADTLRRCWQTVLLQQFHDILPGSSIAWVHQEAERSYATVAQTLEGLIQGSIERLARDADDGSTGTVAFNPAPFAVVGVPALSAAPAARPSSAARTDGGDVVLTSDGVTARVDADGHLTSVVDHATARDVVPPSHPGNVLELFHDRPNQWDAWDIDVAYRRMPVQAVGAPSVRVEGDTCVVERRVGSSAVTQRLRAAGRAVEIETRVDWRERRKLLKLAFPVDVHTDAALSEVQFGHVRRPTHDNTSWDHARFETCAHRWVRVEEAGFGVTLTNDRVYGHDVTRHPRPGGGTFSVVRESLLRAATYPDPAADQGEHVFRHSIVAGDLLDGVAEGYRLGTTAREVVGRPVEALVSVDEPALVVEAVKAAEDGSGDVVVRLYEARGGRGRGRLTLGFPARSAVRVDLLERVLDEQPSDPLLLELRPFEIVTVRVSPGSTEGRPVTPASPIPSV